MSKLTEKINALIANNQTQEAIQILLEKLSPDTEDHKTMLLRSGEYEQLNRDQLNGVLKGEEFSKRKNQINLIILKISKHVEVKAPARRLKINWKWVLSGTLLGAFAIFLVFNYTVDPKPEYLWWIIPETTNFKLVRLNKETNIYKDVTDLSESFFVDNMKDVIVYDKSSERTLLFKNYLSQDTNKIPAIILEPKSLSYWKKWSDLKPFELFDKGVLVTDTVVGRVPGGFIVYSKSNKTTYLIENYKSTKDELFHPAQILSPPSRAYWKCIWQNDSFYLYDRGVDISRIGKKDFEGDDLIVLHPDNNIRYRLENYKEKQDNIFRPAIIEE